MEKWLQSRHVMVELSLLCSISQIFLKSSLCKKTTVNPPHDTSLRKQWETHLLPAATISVRASGRTSLHNWFFRAFARQFVIYLNAPQWRSSQSCPGSTLQLLVSSFCSTFFAPLASAGETEAQMWMMIWVMIPLCSGQAMEPPPAKLCSYLWCLSWGIFSESWGSWERPLPVSAAVFSQAS